MKILRIKNTSDGFRLARCLPESPIIFPNFPKDKAVLLGVVGERLRNHDCENRFLIDTAEGGIAYRSEIILPIESLKFCPFAACKEGIGCSIGSYCGVVGDISEDESGHIRITGGYRHECFESKELTLDLDAAAKLDGVTVEEI